MSRRDWTPSRGGVVFGGSSLVLSALLLTRTLRPTLEAKHYAKDIHGGTEGMRGNLEALARLEETRERAAALLQTVEGLGSAS